MNARWITKMVAYNQSAYSLDAARTIIREKVFRQIHLVAAHQKGCVFPPLVLTGDRKALVLAEARLAKTYWRHFGILTPSWCVWSGRAPGRTDIVNKLLDIGYHALAGMIAKKLETLDIPSDIGLFHIAQSKGARPLVYDIMECYRAIVVDETALTFLRRKKKPVYADPVTIRHFLKKVYLKMDAPYYHKTRRACLTLSYWMDLVLLELRSAVSQGRMFHPTFTPLRHENRCNKKI